MTMKSYLTVTDQFCGAGGSSIGAVAAGVELRLALNHWRLAIETHNANFPDADHDCTDVSATDPRRYPATDILITSPECTSHSLAKGRKTLPAQFGLFDGKRQIDPAAERSRATMWDVPRYAEAHRYRLIIVENVVEARKWAPFDAWWHAMTLLGYEGQIVYFNSQFAHPTPQSRDRMYVVFWRKGNRKPDLDIRPPAYCTACDADVEAVQAWKSPHKQWGRWGRYGVQYVYRCPTCGGEVRPYYYAALNAIDWSNPGERIGDRDRPLKERTIERIRIGIRKFAGQSFTLQTSYAGPEGRARSVLQPMGTQTTRQDQAIITPFLVAVGGAQAHRSDRHFRIDHPTPTVTASSRLALVNPPFIATLRGTSFAQGTDQPLGTLTAGGLHHALVSSPAGFLLQYYGTDNMSGLDQAIPTVTTIDRHALVHMPFILGYANGSGPPRPVTDPTLTVHTRQGQAIVLPQGETPGVEDCHFRMLNPPEIGRAMSFPDDYVVLGTNRDQVRQYGNAVTPPVMAVLLQRCIAALS